MHYPDDICWSVLPDPDLVPCAKPRRHNAQQEREAYLVRRAARRKQKQQQRRTAKRLARMQQHNCTTIEELQQIHQAEKYTRIERYHKLKEWQNECKSLEKKNQTLQIVIDCSHLTWHSDLTIRSLAKQINYISLGLKFNLEKRVNITLTSFTPSSLLAKYADDSYGGHKWYFERKEEPFWEYLEDLSNVIILSPDAEEDLADVVPGVVYVIGGIVDREVRKGETLCLSRMLSVSARRLPVQKYMPTLKNCVLNVNTVADILIDMFDSTSDWESVLEKHIPTRKLRTP